MTTGKSRPGLTLVESLLILTLLVILVRAVLPYRGSYVNPRISKVREDIYDFAFALDLYKIGNGTYPTTSDGLEALIVKPHDAGNNWRGPYLATGKIPLDPWKQPYVYIAPGKHNRASFDVYSMMDNGLYEPIGNW
jgi:general secretion pathway protein G